MENPQLVERLIKIWSQTLGIDDAKIKNDSDFKSLGGDSLKSMAVFTAAAEQGINFSLDLFSEANTIEKLAKIVIEKNSIVEDSFVGLLPSLTPMQSWYLSEGFNEESRYNISLVYDLVSDIDLLLLNDALNIIVKHHGALRQRIKKEDPIKPFKNVKRFERLRDVSNSIVEYSEQRLVTYFDLSTFSCEQQENWMGSIFENLQRSLDIEKGPLIRASLIDLGSDSPSRLIIVMNHIAGDGFSLQILREDLWKVYAQLESKGRADEKVLLSSTSLYMTLKSVGKYIEDCTSRYNESYWQELPWDKVPSIPFDFPCEEDQNINLSNKCVTLRLSREESVELKKVTSQSREHSIYEVLLTAFNVTLAKWLNSDFVKIQVIDNGRNFLINELGVDVSRTMGWLALSPSMLFKIDRLEGVHQNIGFVADEARQISTKYSHYDYLYWVKNFADESTIPGIGNQDKIVFNFMGDRSDADSVESKYVTVSAGQSRSNQSENNRRACIFYCATYFEGDELVMEWNYSHRQFNDQTIRTLVRDYFLELKSYSKESIEAA